jgi:apolipoprotein N-acyltransferase
MALYLAVFCAGLAWAKKRPSMLWFAPMLWVALDFSRAHIFTGFPWMDLGYSQYRNPLLIQLADLTGHHGITFLIVLVNCMIFLIIRRFQQLNSRSLVREFLPAALILIAAFSYSLARFHMIEDAIRMSPRINTRIVQGNIDQSKKWLPAMREQTVHDYLAMSKPPATRNDPDLLIWPETALPFFPIGNPLFKQIEKSLLKPNGPVFITGAPHFVASSETKKISYYNSAFIFEPVQGKSSKNKAIYSTARYDKQHLVPFGEYIPFNRYLPSSMPLVESVGNFSPGRSLEPISCHNAKIGVLICYESIFPDLARQEVTNGANLLVNLTNDGWYGKSSAPWQQLAMVVLRAVENRKSLARAANTGISCFIDPLGNQMELSPLFKPFAMTAELPLLEGLSPFNKYGHFFPVLCLLGLIPWAFWIQRKSNRP